MIILGIETSCDETAASLIEGKRDSLRVLSNVVFSQIPLHRRWGGVVPEVAARNHILKILPVIEQALTLPYLLPKSDQTLRKEIPSLRRGGPARIATRSVAGGGGEHYREVDAIAVTAGPGLLSSLLIGIETAKALAYVWNKPIVAVNHLAGHIYAAWLASRTKPTFPALALIVSGGHTELVVMKDHLHFKIIGRTRDDAAGEAFDKVAKMLGLGYPGGPLVAAHAAKVKNQKSKIKNKEILLPRPMMYDDNFDFSFSGLKTAVLYKTQKDKNIKNNLSSYCHEFQQAVIDVLIYKTIKAAKKYQVKSVILAGGVAANTQLRKQLGASLQTALPRVSYHIPHLQYTTDNAAMIAAAGYFMARLRQGSGGQAKKFTPWQKVKVDCNLSL